MASNLVVPLVMWGKNAPTHCVCSIILTPDEKHILTGCNDGQIILWNMAPDWKVYPHQMLLGHSAAVTCLVLGSNNPDKPYVVSSSDNGEMCLWDLRDGRCIESTKMSSVHTSIQAHQMIHCRDIRLICNGYYPDVHIIHPLSLEILYSLTSRMQPDWISAMCVLRPVSREDDVVVAISNSGVVKVWTLPGGEGKPNQTVFEDESKQIRCLNAQTLRCCAYNQRTVLIVCSKYWQIYDTTWVMGKPSSGQSVAQAQPNSGPMGIYDAGDFSLLCSESSRRGERWCGGEFIGVDRIVVWSTEGKGYLFKLPTNTNPESDSFRKPGNPSSPRQVGPQAYTVLDLYMEKSLECSPAMIYFFGRRERENKLILRGDSEGRIVVWAIPDIHDNKMKLVRQESFEKLPVVGPKCCTSLQETWERAMPTTEGLIDQLNLVEDKQLQITASIYVPTQGRLVCGRDDGSIVIVPATVSIILQLLESGQHKDSLQHQILAGHNGRVNALLYPYNESPRYEPSLLVSGGVDFTVILWDVFTGAKLHTFCVQGGEITQLLVPPESCNSRILPCICSVASDHSLALLSLRERKCIMLAARQLFPISVIKWRPHDDFVIIGTTDGTVYVWQMETGHLDRVVHGVTAEEVLSACDEKLDVGEKLLNPTISIAQAFKRHNLATFKNLANQQLKKAQDVLQQPQSQASHPGLVPRHQVAPMLIQGLKTNTRDPDAHIVYFDTEALIIQLLSEEYAHLSPNTLQSLGFLTPASNQEPQAQLTDSQKKLAEFITKVKDKAENVGQKLQEHAESAGFRPISPMLPRKGGGEGGHTGGSAGGTKRPPRPPPPKLGLQETSYDSLVMQIAQLFLSLLHAWGRDPDLDKLCQAKLGLLCPKRPTAFGLLSHGGHMSLLLPGWQQHFESDASPAVVMEAATVGHWQVSQAVTTNHLLAVIATSNTLMGMTHSTFLASNKDTRATPKRSSSQDGDPDMTQQALAKQGWSLLAALHCVLLPDLIGSDQYKAPQLEMLARRWQDRCLEIREAAQALLLAELRRIGPEGRKKIVEEWSPYLPSYVDPALSLLSEQLQQTGGQSMVSGNNGQGYSEGEEDDEDSMIGGSDSPVHRASQSYESRRRQATAIVMMGVIGAEFGAAMESSQKKSDEPPKKNVAEGFGLQNYSHARHTSKALTFLLLQPPSAKLPAFTPIRRAAVDLLGRGFTVWEPYLDVSAVLLGLLELCVEGDKLVPSMTFGLPLNPRADACRTSRHTLSLIATARPPAFIITMAKEVARYNALAQNAQGQHHHHHLHNSVLIRAKGEILRVIELLVDKIPNDVVELLVEVMDVTVHCLDSANLKARGLQELFPAVYKFTNVSYCSHTRRICVGARNGGVAFYDLKQNKCQILPAHSGAVSAVTFSPDGKFLSSFCIKDNRLMFWQTASTSLFNLGSTQTKCVKVYTTSPINLPPNTNPLKMVKLVWMDNRTVVLLCADGSETRFRV